MPRQRGTVLQIAHVVRDLEKAVAHWTDTLGAGPFYVARFRVDDHLYRGRVGGFDATIAVGYLGDTIIELICSNNAEPSVFNEVLERRGEGLHHYWLAADDLNAEMARYEAAGCPMIAYGDIPGVTRSAMMDTSALLGCYVELQEIAPGIQAVLAQMQAAHANWDGSDPVRPYPGL